MHFTPAEILSVIEFDTMSDQQNPSPPKNLPPKTPNGHSIGPKPHYPNPPDRTNPDPATLREQWRFAIRQYSRWYSQAWGTAILAGLSIFALGWFIKGSNPLPSFKPTDPPPDNHPSSSSSSDSNAGQVNQAP